MKKIKRRISRAHTVADATNLASLVNYLRLELADRVVLARDAVGSAKPPPWLNDRVFHMAREKGLLVYVPIQRAEVRPGDMIATNGNQIARVLLKESLL